MFFNGDIKASQDLFLKTIPLTNACFCETNPIPIKTALNLMGRNVGNLRLPLVDMDPKNLDTLKDALKDYDLI